MKRGIIKDIKEKLITDVAYDNYKEYIDSGETFYISLLNELTPFISQKIYGEILVKYEMNDFFNSQNVEVNYSYHIPNEVVEDIIKNYKN